MAVGMLLSTVSGVAPAASSQRDWTTNTARAKATSAAFCLMSPSQCPLLAAAETLHKRWESQGHVVLDPMVFFGPEVRFTFVSSKFTFLCFFLRTLNTPLFSDPVFVVANDSCVKFALSCSAGPLQAVFVSERGFRRRAGQRTGTAALCQRALRTG